MPNRNDIFVFITTWCVPFSQVVQEVKQFSNAQAACFYINEASAKWWAENHGDDSVAKGHNEAYEPITKLGYDDARYELWGGEQGFHAMLPASTYARLHEAHYKREFDNKGITRPGYLINAYLAGGNLTKEERAKYEAQQREGLQAIADYYK